jgi:hypothetical protein
MGRCEVDDIPQTSVLETTNPEVRRMKDGYVPKDLDDAKVHLLDIVKQGLDKMGFEDVDSSFDCDDDSAELIVDCGGYSLIIRSSDIDEEEGESDEDWENYGEGDLDFLDEVDD